ncbi:MAG TPA: right-handed parallel beta-helix repeat-containing protein [Patescibacteria group bacterium]|nr:right-handed parallel beta-helix repeat-containing protein [Patescibacteria group bacterium]
MDILYEGLEPHRFTVQEEISPLKKHKRKIVYLLVVILVLTASSLLLYLKMTSSEPASIITSQSQSYDSPPKLTPPKPVTLPFPQSVCSGSTFQVTSNLQNARLENCVVFVKGNDIIISTVEFINSPVVVENSSRITFKDVIFSRSLDFLLLPKKVTKEVAVFFVNSNEIHLDHVLMSDNRNGLFIEGSSGIEIQNSFFERNIGDFGAIHIESSSPIRIHDNVFRVNYPVGMYFSNKSGNKQATFEVFKNSLVNSILYGVLIEDWKSNSISKVFNNVILGGRGSGMAVQFDSSPANIEILNNYIGKKTSCEVLTTVLPLNLGNGWCFAKSDGIKLENTQKVTLRGNVLIENERHGLDLRESKEIDVTRNSFVKNGTYAIFAASSYFQSTNNTFHANTSMVHEQDEPAPEAMRVF